MNTLIAEYFARIETHFITSPIIAAYTIIRKNIAFSDGKLRIRLTLRNDDFIELFAYIIENPGDITMGKYSIHWQKQDGTPVKRWDNAPHHPSLPNAPHHIHLSNGSVISNPVMPEILDLLKEIEQEFKQND